VSAFLPGTSRGAQTDAEHPRLIERTLDREEHRARWAVRAAQWRARELAELVFGPVSESSVRAFRPRGAVRGLMVLRVPFDNLDRHREREARFMAAAQSDPVLSEVPLVFVFGPEHG